MELKDAFLKTGMMPFVVLRCGGNWKTHRKPPNYFSPGKYHVYSKLRSQKLAHAHKHTFIVVGASD